MHNRKSRTYPLAICAMLSAIILLLAFTPLGLIDLPLIKATILHVPVIIGAVLLGWRKGTLLGGVFGLASLVKNTIAPSALSFAFSPFIPVPGTDRGSIWALVICLIPRILTGITPALVYAGVRRCFRKKNLGVNTGAAILAKGIHKEESRRFMEYLLSPEAAQIMRAHGIRPLGETLRQEGAQREKLLFPNDDLYWIAVRKQELIKDWLNAK